MTVKLLVGDAWLDSGYGHDDIFARLSLYAVEV